MQLKEKEKKNVEVGSFLLKRLQTEASDQEVDKYKLHVEEVDKITSLILGLASRLSRLDLSQIITKEGTEMVRGLACNDNVHLNVVHVQNSHKSKKEKLLEQMTEAKMLHKNIEKRGVAVGSLLRQYFTSAEYEQYTTFMKTKAMLILQNKVLSELQISTKNQIGTLSTL